MNRSSLLYLLIFFAIIISAIFIIDNGRQLEIGRSTQSTAIHLPDKTAPVIHQEKKGSGNVFDSFIKVMKTNMNTPICILIIQIIILIILSRMLGLVFGKLGQPIVIGEIIAGIMLGPSLLGNFFPSAYDLLFPLKSLGNLQIISQIGLILFMFIVGMEVDIKVMRKRINSAVFISYAGIIFPYFLGICLSYYLYQQFAPPNTSFLSFALFIGIALSITAFPVLARIIQEKGLSKTFVGKMAITCAATDDITAWLILAAIIAIIQAGNPLSAIFTVLLVVIYVVAMLLLVQPMFKRIASIYFTKENLSRTIIAIVFVHLFLSAFLTELLGIHVLFGAFIAGVVIPSNQRFKKLLTDKLEDVSVSLLLPLFFAFTGLRTQIGLLNTTDLWLTCGLVILFAIIGKFGGVSIAARFFGFSWKDSFSLGVLMNTRGLMELIALNIGYDLGILSPEIFTIMVLMALFTTFMTGPALALIERLSVRKKDAIAETPRHALQVLISFGMPQMGGNLLKLLHLFSGNNNELNKVTALHLTPNTEISKSDAIKYEKNSFTNIKAVAHHLHIKLKTIYKTSFDVTKEIVKIAKDEQSNLLMMGAAKSMFSKNMLGGKVKNILDQVSSNVGVFIDKDFVKAEHVGFFVTKLNFVNMFGLVQRFIEFSNCKITIVDEDNLQQNETDLFDQFILNTVDITRIEIVKKTSFDFASLENFDLIIVGLKYFEKAVDSAPMLIESSPSLLIFEFRDDAFSMLPDTKQL